MAEWAQAGIADVQNYPLSPGAKGALAQYTKLRNQQPQFGNARSIGNALDPARRVFCKAILENTDD